jgi:peptide/nickel transport system permease protein
VQWAYHLLLPWACFALTFAAVYVRMIRAYVSETLQEDYVRTARAKGASEPRVLHRHVIRNALLPIVTILGMDLGLALGGAFFIEAVFGLPGLGQVAINAVNGFDLPTTQGVVIFGTLCILAFNLVVDTLYAWIDPRIRLQ